MATRVKADLAGNYSIGLELIMAKQLAAAREEAQLAASTPPAPIAKPTLCVRHRGRVCDGNQGCCQPR